MRKFNNILMVGLTLLLFQVAVQSQTTGSIAGAVTDPNGAYVPGATVIIKGEGGQEFRAVTNDGGTYLVPAVQNGTYTVTVSVNGFKTSTVTNVKVDVGTPKTVDVRLALGDVGETVEISSGGEVLQTQTATVGSTITGRQITETPISSRDALDLILKLPGVASVGAPRRSSINGLPKAAIQITTDGVDVQVNDARSSDGFFTFVRPRVDAIDEVTISTANPGAESSGDGAIQVRFVTKRGNNRYTGSAYAQIRNTWLNSAYWYNNRDFTTVGVNNIDGKALRDDIKLFQPGVAVGGPLPYFNFGEGGPMFHSGKDKAFFFVNYEQFRLPGSLTRNRTVANPAVQQGIYSYQVGGVTRTVNLFDIAGAAGLPSTIDPTVNTVLNEINAATANTGTFSDIAGNVNARRFSFQNITNGYREFLAVRLDFNIHKNHSIEYVQNRQVFHPSIDTINGADAPFPGGQSFGQGGIRKSWVGAVRSTLSRNIVNEARFAQSGGGTEFNQGSGPGEFASQGGFSLGALLPGTTALRAGASNSTSFSTTPTGDFTDNVTWIRGNHTINFGGQRKFIKDEGTSVGRWVPSVAFGITTADTAAFALFTGGATGNIPGANPDQLAEARAFYAGLTGRVLSYTNTAVLTADGRFAAHGTSRITSVEQTQYGLYAQDTWRMRPNLTLSYGLRWQPQLGVVNATKNQSRLVDFAMVYGTSGEGNIFRPGTFTGTAAQNRLLEVGEKILPDDWINFAPSVGIVWSPSFGDKSFLRKIFGANGKSVIRGGYSTAFVREGLNVSNQVVAGPGGTRNISRSTAITGSLTLGTLFRTPGNPNLTPFNFVEEPSFPITLSGTDQAFGVDPNLTTGYVHSFSFGIQRELDKNTVIEARYVGNRSVNGWRLYSISEINTIENGLAEEFKLAQANLYANVTANNGAGRCQGNLNPATTPNCQYNFAYFGPGTGTSPLPIALAYIIGNAGGNRATLTPGALGSSGTVTATGALTVSNYTNALFRNMATFAGLNRVSASPLGYAAGLASLASLRTNAVNAGLPANFLRSNGELNSGAFILGNSRNTSYDSLVIEVRRRLSAGLRVQASYVFSKALGNFFSNSGIVNNSTSLREDGLDLARTVQPFDLTHNFKLDSTYDLPIGRGRWLFSNAGGLLNSLVGGFTISPVISWQSGSPIAIGNVQLVGMTVKELQKAVKIRKTATGVFWLPEDIIVNSQRAFNTSLSSTAPGGYASSFVSGPPSGRFIAPSGFDNCQQPYAGKCGFNNLVIHGPGFFKFDVGVSKRFAIGESRSFEVRANILNATNAANFRVGGAQADTTGSGCCTATFGELLTGSAYRDNNTTNDPGGRVIDIVLRFNF